MTPKGRRACGPPQGIGIKIPLRFPIQLGGAGCLANRAIEGIGGRPQGAAPRLSNSTFVTFCSEHVQFSKMDGSIPRRAAIHRNPSREFAADQQKAVEVAAHAFDLGAAPIHLIEAG